MSISAVRPRIAAVPAPKLRVSATAPAAETPKPAARKTSDTVCTIGEFTMTGSMLALGGGVLLSLFAPAGAQMFRLAGHIMLGVGAGGFAAAWGLGKWVDKLDREGK